MTLSPNCRRAIEVARLVFDEGSMRGCAVGSAGEDNERYFKAIGRDLEYNTAVSKAGSACGPVEVATCVLDQAGDRVTAIAMSGEGVDNAEVVGADAIERSEHSNCSCGDRNDFGESLKPAHLVIMPFSNRSDECWRGIQFDPPLLRSIELMCRANPIDSL